MTVTMPLWLFIVLLTYILFGLVSDLMRCILDARKLRRLRKEQEENSLVGKWVRPTGERYVNGVKIPAWMKNEYFIITDVKDDRVMLSAPLSWVKKDEITMNIDAREAKK